MTIDPTPERVIVRSPGGAMSRTSTGLPLWRAKRKGVPFLTRDIARFKPFPR